MKDSSTNEALASAHPLLSDMLREAESGASQFGESLLRVLTVVKAATEGMVRIFSDTPQEYIHLSRLHTYIVGAPPDEWVGLEPI